MIYEEKQDNKILCEFEHGRKNAATLRLHRTTTFPSSLRQNDPGYVKYQVYFLYFPEQMQTDLGFISYLNVFQFCLDKCENIESIF